MMPPPVSAQAGSPHDVTHSHGDVSAVGLSRNGGVTSVRQLCYICGRSQARAGLTRMLTSATIMAGELAGPLAMILAYHIQGGES
jgi:hypothetical protein